MRKPGFKHTEETKEKMRMNHWLKRIDIAVASIPEEPVAKPLPSESDVFAMLDTLSNTEMTGFIGRLKQYLVIRDKRNTQ